MTDGGYIHIYIYINGKSRLTSLVWGSLWLAPIMDRSAIIHVINLGGNFSPS